MTDKMCFHCQRNVSFLPMEVDYLYVERTIRTSHNDGGNTITRGIHWFHTACYKEIAGDEYIPEVIKDEPVDLRYNPLSTDEFSCSPYYGSPSFTAPQKNKSVKKPFWDRDITKDLFIVVGVGTFIFTTILFCGTL